MRITSDRLGCSPEFERAFDSHLILIYTGQVRLAKNLLSSVIRHWYRGSAGVTEIMKRNYETAEQCESALREGEEER